MRSTYTSSIIHSSRVRRLTCVAIGVCVAALLAALVVVLAESTVASVGAPFVPTAEQGAIAEDSFATLADGIPAITRLDPALREAMQRAEGDAAREGLPIEVHSGWRSEQYQQWLFDEAVHRYASAETAREFVATPDRSRHVTGDAIDVGPLDTQFWLIEHGWVYGICQTYANERWHFELATTPGGVCPEMNVDAAS